MEDTQCKSQILKLEILNVLMVIIGKGIADFTVTLLGPLGSLTLGDKQKLSL